METKECPESWQLDTLAETLNARNLGEDEDERRGPADGVGHLGRR